MLLLSFVFVFVALHCVVESRYCILGIRHSLGPRRCNKRCCKFIQVHFVQHSMAKNKGRAAAPAGRQPKHSNDANRSNKGGKGQRDASTVRSACIARFKVSTGMAFSRLTQDPSAGAPPQNVQHKSCSRQKGPYHTRGKPANEALLLCKAAALSPVLFTAAHITVQHVGLLKWPLLLLLLLSLV